MNLNERLPWLNNGMKNVEFKVIPSEFLFISLAFGSHKLNVTVDDWEHLAANCATPKLFSKVPNAKHGNSKCMYHSSNLWYDQLGLEP